MVFCDQPARNIGDADAERRLVERGHQDPRPVRIELHQPRRAAAAGLGQRAFVDQLDLTERSEPVGDDGTA